MDIWRAVNNLILIGKHLLVLAIDKIAQWSYYPAKTNTKIIVITCLLDDGDFRKSKTAWVCARWQSTLAVDFEWGHLQMFSYWFHQASLLTFDRDIVFWINVISSIPIIYG
jgi:hypothetical protein